MPSPEVRYCTTEDGVRIAYSVNGEGSPLVVCPQAFESFAVEHLFPAQQAFFAELANGHALVRFDGRGTGLSQRAVQDYSLDCLAMDVDAVVRAATIPSFAMWASGGNAPLAITYAVRHPENVTHLILYGAATTPIEFAQREALLAYATLLRTRFSAAIQTFTWALANREKHPEGAAQLAMMFEQSVSGEMAARALEAATSTAWDVRELLPKVQSPTLVLHRRQDPLVVLAEAQLLAAAIPDTVFMPLDGDVHYFALGDPRPVVTAVLAFLAGEAHIVKRVTASKADGATFRTVLFTDLVGHTEMMQRLGDEQGRAVLREHERILRETLAAHVGEEIKTMGDGFMASFGSVTKAVECAIALQRAFEAHTESMPEPLHVRVGLNAGEPIAEEGDLFGSTVILAARVAAQAGAGEILVPDPVRHLLSGKGFLFSDRGDVVLKGFEDPVRLYEVRWREERAV